MSSKKEEGKKVVWLSTEAQKKLKKEAERRGISQGEILAELIAEHCQ
jgi:hypothetical protein